MINDTDGDSTNWSVYNDVIQVVSNPPTITSYNVTDNSILRTETTIVLVEVSDIENDDQDMSVTVQYRVSSGDWMTNYFEQPWYNSSDSRWETNFTPSSSSVLGDYDIRIMVNDTDSGSSGWSIAE